MKLIMNLVMNCINIIFSKMMQAEEIKLNENVKKSKLKID